MLNNQTLDKLRALKLTGMADALTEQFNSPASDMSFEERLAILIEREWITRENKRLARRLIFRILNNYSLVKKWSKSIH